MRLRCRRRRRRRERRIKQRRPRRRPGTRRPGTRRPGTSRRRQVQVQHGYGHTCLHASARGGVTRALSPLSLPLALSCKEPSRDLWSVVASGPRNLFRNGEFRPIYTSFRFSPSQSGEEGRPKLPRRHRHSPFHCHAVCGARAVPALVDINRLPRLCLPFGVLRRGLERLCSK